MTPFVRWAYRHSANCVACYLHPDTYQKGGAGAEMTPQAVGRCGCQLSTMLANTRRSSSFLNERVRDLLQAAGGRHQHDCCPSTYLRSGQRDPLDPPPTMRSEAHRNGADTWPVTIAGSEYARIHASLLPGVLPASGCHVPQPTRC